MVSFGGGGGSSKQKSKNQSKTVFPGGFFDQAYNYFGDVPDYNPEYVGFNDFDRVEDTVYGNQRAKVDDAYRNALKIKRRAFPLRPSQFPFEIHRRRRTRHTQQRLYFFTSASRQGCSAQQARPAARGGRAPNHLQPANRVGDTQ